MKYLKYHKIFESRISKGALLNLLKKTFANTRFGIRYQNGTVYIFSNNDANNIIVSVEWDDFSLVELQSLTTIDDEFDHYDDEDERDLTQVHDILLSITIDSKVYEPKGWWDNYIDEEIIEYLDLHNKINDNLIKNPDWLLSKEQVESCFGDIIDDDPEAYNETDWSFSITNYFANAITWYHIIKFKFELDLSINNSPESLLEYSKFQDKIKRGCKRLGAEDNLQIVVETTCKSWTGKINTLLGNGTDLNDFQTEVRIYSKRNLKTGEILNTLNDEE